MAATLHFIFYWFFFLLINFLNFQASPLMYLLIISGIINITFYVLLCFKFKGGMSLIDIMTMGCALSISAIYTYTRYASTNHSTAIFINLGIIVFSFLCLSICIIKRDYEQ